MHRNDERLRLGEATRHVYEAASVLSSLAFEAGLFTLGDQVIDLELELLNLHGELVELGRKDPQLRRGVKHARQDAHEAPPF
jgi:hypothetical protein